MRPLLIIDSPLAEVDLTRRAVLHHDHSLDDEIGTVLARERFRRLKAAHGEDEAVHCPGNPWTQTAIARRLGVTGSTLSMWESGRHPPATLKSWHDWAAAYKRDLADVIAEVEKQRRDQHGR
jgi:DNA-binding XRE family transcriptional regulator